MINCTSNVNFFCNRKITSHKVRTKSSLVRKHLQRNLKLDRAKLRKNSMRLTKPSWRPRQSHPLSQVHRHRYYRYRSSPQVRIWSCLMDLSFYLSSFTSHITNYCTKDILNNLYKIGCDSKQSKLCLSEGLMVLLSDIGRAYVCLTHYDCAKALQLFCSLPPQHYNTGWVLCQVNYNLQI